MIELGHAPESARRLRSLVVFDSALAAGGGLFAIVVSLAVTQSATLFGLGVLVLVGALGIFSALVPLSRDDIGAAVLRMSVANWILAIGVTIVATFAWPLLMQAALLPSALAASFVSRSSLRRYVAISLVAAIAVACLGIVQDVTGLSGDTPTWVKDLVLLSTGPPLAALVVLVALQHNLRLQTALDDESKAREALAAHADELKRSRLRVVAATDRARRRIERDLHDGAQSRLIAVNLGLARLRAALVDDPDAARTILEEVRNEVHLAHGELRDLAHGIYPTVLTQHGVVAAVTAAADHCTIPVQFDLAEVGRHHPDIEAALYFCVVEALQNASRHSRGTVVRVRMWRDTRAVAFEVRDDGIGFDPLDTVGNGLISMADRLGAIDGDVWVTSRSGAGTSIRGEIPLATPAA